MSAHIITYDLLQPGRDYEALYQRIMSYGTWARITESSWVIITDQSPVSIRDYLMPALDSNDKLLVGTLGAVAWVGMFKEVSDWLHASL